MLKDPILMNDWHVVAPAEVLDATGIYNTRLMGEDIVRWRSGDKVMAWKDLCVHRGVKLSLGQIVEGALECPYHGWTYDETGQCIKIPAHPEQSPPAKAHTITYHAKIERGLVWVCMNDEPDPRPLPVFPEWEDDTYKRVLCGPYEFKAASPRVVENFLDAAHFPFVHENSLGTRERPELAPYDVVVEDGVITASPIRVFQPDPDGTGEGKEVEYTYKVFRPLTAYFRKEATEKGFAIMLMVTPVDELVSHAWMWMMMNHGHDIPDEEWRKFQDEVAGEDVPIVESQRPELLPLDLQAELHLRSDKTAIAYRQWLNEIGLTYGTA
jgi:phenylpropionate dioxygenase-like ring-hydroxylating dioxygenase large terminal subunit